jgi:hypothetical protein
LLSGPEQKHGRRYLQQQSCAQRQQSRSCCAATCWRALLGQAQGFQEPEHQLAAAAGPALVSWQLPQSGTVPAQLPACLWLPILAADQTAGTLQHCLPAQHQQYLQLLLQQQPQQCWFHPSVKKTALLLLPHHHPA